MTIESRTMFLRKDEAILREEAQRLRLGSWVRLGLGFVALLVFTIELLVGEVAMSVFTMRAVCAGVLTLASALYIFGYSKPAISRNLPFAVTALDVSVVTGIMWSYAIGAPLSFTVSYTLFGLYFVAVILTALQHDPMLSVFAGVLSLVEYAVFFTWYRYQGAGDIGFLSFRFGIPIIFLASGVVAATLISWKNLRTFKEIVSSEIRYHEVVDRLPEMLFTMDRRGNFLWSNKAVKPILGITPPELLLRNIREFLVKPDSLQLEGETVRGTFEMRDTSGQKRFVDCALRKIDGNGERASWEGLITDTTDREAALAQREEMASRLFTYQKMESLGTLASGMAHDFNNTLQTVNDLVGMVVRDSQEAETRQRMDLISESLADARFLVSELFALGRKQPLNYTTVNLTSFFQNIVPFFNKQLGQRYSVEFKGSKEQLWIQGDADYLKRIFQNLVGNARDAMPGGGTVIIECKSVREKGRPNTVLIRVSDTGTGIPKDLSERVFDPFFTTKKPGKGTGLGLAMVRQIVTLHNGRVSIEKPDGFGTVFQIELPGIDKEDLDLDTKQIMLNRLPTRVLLLEDDVKIRDILKIFIKGMGYPVCEASNKLEAVSELQKYQDDCQVVIMDWKLGNEDPHKVIKALRAINRFLVVIVVSGYPPKQKSIDAMRIHKWFTKPYDKNMIDLEIQRALYRSSKALEKSGDTTRSRISGDTTAQQKVRA